MKKWFKHPMAYLAILIALVGSVSFIAFAIPSFSDLPTGTENLNVVIVDQDKSTVSEQIVGNLKDKLPFKQVTTADSLSKSKSKLNDRQVSLVIEISSSFSESVMAQKVPSIKYFVSDSNGMLQNSLNKSVISQVKDQIATAITSAKTTQALATMLAPEIKQKAMASGNTDVPQIQKEIQQTAQTTAAKMSGKVSSSTVHLNKMSQNYQYQMAPMFINLGAYLGIMLMSVVLALMFMGARHSIGKKLSFVAAQLNGLIAIVVVPFLSMGLVRCFIQFGGGEYFNLVGTQIVFGLAVFEFTFALALLLNGLPSMVIQLPLMAMQVMAGGAVIPREAMNSFYSWVSEHTPMYQGVYTSLNALYGGGNQGAYLSALLWIMIVSLLVSLIIVWAGYRSNTRNTFAKIVNLES